MWLEGSWCGIGVDGRAGSCDDAMEQAWPYLIGASTSAVSGLPDRGSRGHTLSFIFFITEGLGVF